MAWTGGLAVLLLTVPAMAGAPFEDVGDSGAVDVAIGELADLLVDVLVWIEFGDPIINCIDLRRRPNGGRRPDVCGAVDGEKERLRPHLVLEPAAGHNDGRSSRLSRILARTHGNGHQRHWAALSEPDELWRERRRLREARQLCVLCGGASRAGGDDFPDEEAGFGPGWSFQLVFSRAVNAGRDPPYVGGKR